MSFSRTLSKNGHQPARAWSLGRESFYTVNRLHISQVEPMDGIHLWDEAVSFVVLTIDAGPLRIKTPQLKSPM